MRIKADSNIGLVVRLIKAAGKPLTVDELHLAHMDHGMNRAQVQKAVENAVGRGLLKHDGGPRAKKRYSLTPAAQQEPAEGTAATAPTPAPAALSEHHVNSAAARPWAQAAAESYGKTPPAELLPSVPAADVAGLPVMELDIDAVHRRRPTVAVELQEIAVPVPVPTTADEPRATIEGEPDFLCALYSDGVLNIESHGHSICLPLEHTRRLMHYLESLAVGQVLEAAGS